MKPRYVKYGNQRHNKHASKREADVAQKLAVFAGAGKIQDLKEQVPFVLYPARPGHRSLKYVADFVFTEKGKQVVMDAKGFRTAVYKIKKRMMLEIHGIVVEEV